MQRIVDTLSAIPGNKSVSWVTDVGSGTFAMDGAKMLTTSWQKLGSCWKLRHGGSLGITVRCFTDRMDETKRVPISVLSGYFATKKGF